jgi:hypothetical protein
MAAPRSKATRFYDRTSHSAMPEEAERSYNLDGRSLHLDLPLAVSELSNRGRRNT